LPNSQRGKNKEEENAESQKKKGEEGEGFAMILTVERRVAHNP